MRLMAVVFAAPGLPGLLPMAGYVADGRDVAALAAATLPFRKWQRCRSGSGRRSPGLTGWARPLRDAVTTLACGAVARIAFEDARVRADEEGCR